MVNENSRHFGDIEGFPAGVTFDTRKELAASGIHRPLVAGISGSQSDGADSIVLSGGYEDDEDQGDLIIYTGHGGNDPNTGRQIADQDWTRGNQALRVSQLRGLPVRVVRGSGLKSDFAPQNGLRYDGLYRVDESWHETGKSGFRICRFRLLRDNVTPLVERMQAPQVYSTPKRIETSVQRIVRSTSVAQSVKEIYDSTCQACCRTIETPVGRYAEAAHIRPLGTPHCGPDVTDNVLCLCPSCHVLFDYGAFTISDNLVLISSLEPSLGGRALAIHMRHSINLDHIRYHRQMFT